MSQHGVGPRAVSRSVAFLTAGVLAVPALAGCGSEDPAGKPLAGQDIQPAARDRITDGGTLRWAVDSVPETLNTFQSDADATTARVAQAVLPSMFRMDADGRPERNPAYLESAEVVETEPKQVVLYKLDQRAVWSDGREIGAADFAAQWRALSGKDTAYWTARNAGYDRIEKVERGDNALEVRVTFSRSYADWRSLFSPLYPKDVMGTPDSFNDGARKKLKVTAGPFTVKKLDRKDEVITLTRNPRWWGQPAKLSEIVLRTVARDKRASELAAGTLDLAEIDPSQARRITVAARPQSSSSPLMGPGADRSAADALHSWAVANGTDDEASDEETVARKKLRRAAVKYARQQQALRGFEVRKSLEPAFTQLALNGAEGPLADERVRRAVARALDRKELAKAVLKPARTARRTGRKPPRPVRPGRLRRQQRRPRRPGHQGGPGPARGRRVGAGRPDQGAEEEGGEGGRRRGREGGQVLRGRVPQRRRFGHRRRGRQGPAGRQGAPREGPDPPRPGRQAVQAAAPGRRPRRVRPQGHRRPRGPRGRPARQERQAAHAPLRAPLRARLPDAAHGGRPHLPHAGARRYRHGDLQGLRRVLLQGPHRVRPVRPRPVLLARHPPSPPPTPVPSTPSRSRPPTVR